MIGVDDWERKNQCPEKIGMPVPVTLHLVIFTFRIRNKIHDPRHRKAQEEHAQISVSWHL